MPHKRPKQEEVSITEAEFKLLQQNLGEDIDLIEGARIHARREIRLMLTGEEMEDLLDCVADAARQAETRKTEARLAMLEAKLTVYWEAYFYEPDQA
jgi:hypothetical protein